MKIFKDIIKFCIGTGVVLILISFIQSETKTLNQEKISMAFNKYIDTIHPQKIYLHLDKNHYYAKERINFCSYLLDGNSHRPDTADGHIYVELINPYRQLSQIIRVKQTNGAGTGSFYLSDTIPEGNYQVRAYTNRMKNYHPSFFFIKNITIQNPSNKYIINHKQAGKNRSIVLKFEEERAQYEISFFPEGGQLLTGKRCRIAFKVVNKFGQSAEISGEVFNNKHEKITDLIVEHKGMGSFYFTPKKDESYYAKINLNNNKTKKIALPPSQQNSVSLSVDGSPENIKAHILSNRIYSADRPANEFILIGQVRGKIFYSKALNLIDHDTLLEIKKENFPPGIVQFTLINSRFLPVSERLFFIYPPKQYSFNINSVADKDSMDIQISSDSDFHSKSFINASLSVILIENGYELPKENIVSELLLTSDLPGIIEEPSYYLQLANDRAKKHVDLLMLTHGWTRYYWSDILSEKYPDQPFESEQGIVLKGKITHDIIEIPYKDASVKLSIMDQYNDHFSTVSGDKGEFRFENLNYNDTIDVKLIARKLQGGKNLLIHVENNPTDAIVDYSGNFFLTTHSEINKKEYRRINNDIAREKSKERERELDSIFSKSIYGRPDNVIWSKEIPPGSSNLLEVLQGRVPGLSVTGDKVRIRGINTLLMSTDPLVLVDGVPTDIDVLKSIPPVQVDRIEILKGPSAAIYGSRGGNGVIAIYSKQGMHLIKGEISFSMLGYHIAEKFNQPNGIVISDREEEKKLPLTIYWSPKLKLTPNQVIHQSFAMPKVNSPLYLVIEGIDQEGNPAVAYTNIAK